MRRGRKGSEGMEEGGVTQDCVKRENERERERQVDNLILLRGYICQLNQRGVNLYINYFVF